MQKGVKVQCGIGVHGKSMLPVRVLHVVYALAGTEGNEETYDITRPEYGGDLNIDGLWLSEDNKNRFCLWMCGGVQGNMHNDKEFKHSHS